MKREDAHKIKVGSIVKEKYVFYRTFDNSI